MRGLLAKIFPVFEWGADYDRSTAARDATAGATVGVMLIPQSMAYAMLAGLPPRYGLYAGFVPLLIYPILGSSRHLSVGPVAIDMLLVSAGVGAVAATQTEHIQLAILLAAMTGLIELLMGLLRFGFFVNFLSRPVIAGFMTAAPLIIAASQLDNLMGVELADTQYVHLKIMSAVEHFGALNPSALGIGIGGIVLLMGLERWRPRWPAALIWVAIATLVTWATGLERFGLAIVGDVPGELPTFELAAWDFDALVSLAPTAVTLALVQFMSVVSLGQAFAADHDYSIDANRELFAIGASNLVGSFFRSIPISGSFSRSAVNNRAGAETPVTNIVAGLLVGLAVLLLTPLFFYLPKSALAAIIIVACVGMVDLPELRRLLETRWIDGLVALLTFAATLGIGIQQGILIGIGISILVVLYDLTRPDLVELGHIPGTREFRDLDRNPDAERIPGVHIVRIDSRFSFANAQTLKDELLAELDEPEPARALVLEVSGVNKLDTTAVRALRDVVEELTEGGVELYVAGAKGAIRDVLQASGLTDRIGVSHFYMNTHQAIADLLEDWERQEQYEATDREKRRKEMAEARQKLEDERERLEEQRRSIDREKRRLQEEIDQHQSERDHVDTRRDQLRRELREAQKRREQLHSAHEEYESTLEQLEERRRELAEREEEAEQRRADGGDHAEELQAILDERDRLREELDEHATEHEEIAEAREELEEQLDRAEKRRDQLRSERRKMQEREKQMREEREELETERKRLEAERRKAGHSDRESDDTDEHSEDDEEDETSR